MRMTNGSDSFNVTVSDGTATSSQTVAVIINPVNDLPTGSVTISGTATQDETLTAVTSTISDEDGLGDFSYQWLADNVAITDATESTLTLSQAEVDKAITVKVSYTDGYGASEELTSSASAAVVNVNDAPAGSVTVSGTATQGETLTAVTSTISDEDGLGDFSYQWFAGDVAITNATESTLTLSQAEVDKVITVKVSYTDGYGASEELTSSASAAVVNVNDAPAGSVTVSGTATQGETLTAVTSTISDEDGLGDFSYQWFAGDVAITNATESTLTLSQAEVDKVITVKVSYTDGYGASEELTSSASAAVVNVNDAPAGSVTVSGTATQGETLTAVTSTISDEDGLGDFSYQWFAGDVAITNATESTLTLSQAEVDKVITVKVSYTDGYGASEELTSSASAAVVNVNDAPAGSVTVSGTATQGETLTAVTSTISDEDGLGDFSYQWFAGDVAITNATESTLTLSQAEVDKVITVKVSYTDGYGASEELTSSASAAVVNVNDAPAGSVTVSGTATQGETLTAVTSTISDEDGLGDFSYQWFAGDVAITNATESTLTLSQAEVDKVITVKVSYTDGYGASEELTSSASAAVVNVNDAPAGSVTVSGTATQGETLTAVTSTISDEDGLGDFSYQWFAGDVAITNATESTLTLSQAEVDKVITVKVSYTDGYGASEELTSSASAAVVNVNDAPAGSVTVSGTATQGETLTAVTSTISDEDGLGDFSYQWFAGDVAITNATESTLTLSQAEVDKVITVKVSYTDGYGASEELTSSASAAVVNVNDAPTISTTASLTTAEDTATAAIAFSGTDLDGDTLNFSFSDPAKGSVVNNNDGTFTYTPDANENGADSFTLTVNDGTVDVSQTIDVAIIEKTYTVTVGSAVTGSGNRYFIDGSEAPELILEPGHIYKFDLSHSSTSNHPFDLDVSELDFNLGITTTGSRGSDQIITVTVPDDASGAIDYLCTLHAGMGNTANFKFAQEITISHTDSEANSALYEHQSLVFVSSETEHTTVAMSSGSLGTLSEDLSFMHVELSNSSYDQGISVSDVILQLRDIVGLSTLDGKHKIAADINGDGEIAINDVVSNLRHIVGLDTIKECALVNSADEVVTSLTNSTIADLSIIQYGDVDLSATFLIA